MRVKPHAHTRRSLNPNVHIQHKLIKNCGKEGEDEEEEVEKEEKVEHSVGKAHSICMKE